jgi:hemoglobin/transferrin/lactoferrin receptor protein
MKKIGLLLFGVCFASLFLHAQRIKIIDGLTENPIENVRVYLENEQVVLAESDVNGDMILPEIGEHQELIFKHPDYVVISSTLYNLKLSNYTQRLNENINSLEEVVISASRFEEKRKDVAQKIQVIGTKELQYMNQSSTADVLANSGNVFVQKSQLGGGSPIIRGFETNKVLLVVDGVRMNNAIYRGGHLQNVITLDNSMLDRVEVIFGPGSVVYGSDALGGVMSFRTKSAQFSATDALKITAGAYTRYMSAVNGYAAHGDVSIGSKRFAALTSITFNQFGDLRQGARRNPFYGSFGSRNWYVDQVNGVDVKVTNSDTNLQVGSGYNQIDLMQKFAFKQNQFVSHELNIQYSTSSNIDRYDRLTQTSGNNPKFAEWYYGPQKRLFSAYTYMNSNATRLSDHLRVIAAYQNIEESRMDRRFQKNLRNNRIEQVDVLSLNVDVFKRKGKHEFRYGLEGVLNTVNSKAFVEDIVADTTGSLDTRYPDGGSTYNSAALFGTHTVELSDKLILNDGIRFSMVNLQSNWNDKTFFPFPFNTVNQNFKAVNGNIGLIYMPRTDMRIVLTGSTGFRAPNVDDMTKVFESVPGKVVAPNPYLKPEFTYNGELSVSKTFLSQLTASVTGWYTSYTNALTVDKGTFNGMDSVLYDGDMSQVLTTVNKGKAFLYGVEAMVSGNLNRYFALVGSVNYTYGRIKTDTTDYPLDHIPPVYGKLSLISTVNKFKGEFFTQFSGWKKLADYNLIGEDNFAYATPLGMPSWYTLNVRLGYQFTKDINLQVACENILDQNYRMFASNISAPGRNFVVTLRGNF